MGFYFYGELGSWSLNDIVTIAAYYLTAAGAIILYFVIEDEESG